jgi:hypothetical protein
MSTSNNWFNPTMQMFMSSAGNNDVTSPVTTVLDRGWELHLPKRQLHPIPVASKQAVLEIWQLSFH